MAIESVTPEFLERTFNSPEFNAGVARIVGISEKKGYESIFGAAKKVGEDKLIYTPEIVVGDGGAVSRRIGLERARQAYQSTFGRAPETHTSRGFKFFNRFCKIQGEDYELKFPHLEARDSWELEANQGNINDFYVLFEVHTHPNGNCVPSKSDLRCMNDLRNTYHGLERIIPKTISVIVAALHKSDARYLPICFLQEKREVPLSDPKILRGKEEIAKKHSIFREQMFLASVFGRSMEARPRNNNEDLYNVAYAFFDKSEKKMDFGVSVPVCSMKWEDFAFECREISSDEERKVVIADELEEEGMEEEDDQ
jgi:hypothetical protein